MKKATDQQKNLTRRYLIWYYKFLKEELDKIDRYFTQNRVDDFVIKKLKLKQKANLKYQKQVQNLDEYCQLKLSRAQKNKFSSIKEKNPSSEYIFLQDRFKAVEDAIKHFLGIKELNLIRKMYEAEMTSRILSAREH